MKSTVSFFLATGFLKTALALRFPYLQERANITDLPQVSARDDRDFWSVAFRDGGCGGTANYGGFDNKPYSCYNLVHDKPWDSMVVGLGGGLDLMFFEGLDCCTSSSNNPCSIYTGAQSDTCVTSIGSNTPAGKAGSFAVVNHAFNGASGPADQTACAGAGGKSCPTKSGSCSKRSLPDTTSKFESCESADNCEVYTHPRTGRTQIRFKEGMGPDSDWYHHNVRLHDAHAVTEVLKDGSQIKKRDDACSYYNSDRDTMTVQFGQVNPKDGSHTMYDHCQSSSCENIMWSMESYRYDGTSTQVGIKLNFEAGGQWDSHDPSNRNHFIDAVVFQSNASSSETQQVLVDPAYLSSEQDITYYTGMSYVDINRYVNKQLQGYASLTISSEDTTPDSCDTAYKFLTGAISDVTGIGGGFFGAVGDLACGHGGQGSS